jgi:hypothetical protein
MREKTKDAGEPQSPKKKSRERRVILFPTEPTSIDPKRIEEAVKSVIAKRKKKPR